MKPSRLSASRLLFALLLSSGVLSTSMPAHAAQPAPAGPELLTPPLLVAQNYSDAHDPAHYLVSEKLDGVPLTGMGNN